MTATKQDIREWLAREVTPVGQKVKDCTHMLVVCDTFDNEDYPVYIEKSQDIRKVGKVEVNVRKVVAEFNGKNMQRVMEVYSFNYDIEDQLSEHRAFHYD